MNQSASDPSDPDFSGVIIHEPALVTTIKSFARYPLKALRQYKRKQLYKNAKRKYSVMSGIIQCRIEQDSHSDVRKTMRHAAVILAKIDLLNKRIIRATSFVGSISIVILLYYQSQFHDTLVFMLLLATGVIAAIGRLLQIINRTSNKWTFFTYAIIGAVSGIAAYAQSPSEFHRLWHIMPNVNEWTYLLFQIMSLSLYISLVSIPSFILVAQLANRRIPRYCPDYAATEELGLTLEHLSVRGIKAGTLDNRNDAIFHLESAAILISDGVPRKFTTPNLSAQSALRERCQLAAAAIRELETRVAFADMKTLDKIRETTADIVTAICRGTYDIHPQADPPQVPHLSLIRKIGQASQTLLIGTLPIGIILGLRYGDVKLSPQFNNWAIAAAILWAVITLISALDPLYRNRLKAVQDFISAFRGGTS